MTRIQRNLMVSSLERFLTWSLLLGLGLSPLVHSQEIRANSHHVTPPEPVIRNEGALPDREAFQKGFDDDEYTYATQDGDNATTARAPPTLSDVKQEILEQILRKRLLEEEDTILDSIPGYRSTTSAPTSAPRPDDFSNFNELLRDTVISLPDTDINEMFLFQTLSIRLRNLECSQLRFENVRLSKDFRSNQAVGLGADVAGLGLRCEFDFEWAYIFLTGNGHANVLVADSGANFGIDFYSKDYALYPPHSAKITTCTTSVFIGGIEFSGNIASQIFNMFEQLIVDVLHGLLNAEICGYVQELGGEMIGLGLEVFYELISPYLEPVEDWRYNVTFPESNMLLELPPDVDLLTWNDEGGFGEFFGAALETLESSMTSLGLDPDAPNVTRSYPNGTLYPEGYDLGINMMLREYLLDDNSTFELDLTAFGGGNSSLALYQSHDQLTQTNFSLLSLKVFGLDTFTDIQPFQRYGNHTLENLFSWDYLSIEAVVQMEMEASTLEDSFIRDAERVDPFVEQMKLTVGVQNVEAIVAIMVGLNPGNLAFVSLGSVLDVPSLVPCLLASFHEMVIAGFNVTVGDIELPTVEGLVSPGLDRLAVDAAEIAFFMFKGTVLQMLPSLFQSTVRDLVTDSLDNATCPEFEAEEEDSFVDLRDLLLSGDDAKALGGTGEAPYGDLAATVYGIGQGMYQEVEPDGTLGLNSLVIQPVTEALSGQEGMLLIPGELFNFTTNEENQAEFKTLVNRFEFAIYDLTIDNLDTVVHPMDIVQPINHPYITQSNINMGPLEGAPLNVTVGMLMALDIDNSPLAMDNIITMGFSVASVELSLQLLTMVSANNLLNYPLGDGLDINCWFATLPPPELDPLGYSLKGAPQRGIEIRELLATMSDLQFAINCLQCSPGMASLPDLVDIWDRAKVTDVLSYRLPRVVQEFVTSDTMQFHIDRWVVNAPYACPHRPEYQIEYEQPKTWETPEFDQITVEASDTIFFSVLVAAQVGFVLLVETHYPWELDTLQYLSGQDGFEKPEGSDIIDWTNLTQGFDDLADDVRAYVGNSRFDNETGMEDLGINILVRDMLADENGTIDFVDLLGGDPFDFVVEGVVVLVHSIRVRGLDTFSRFDVLKPVAPQTVLNSVFLQELEVDLDVSMGSRTDPPQIITMSFALKDLNATIPLFAAFDINFMRELDLGHFLLGGRVFPCLMAAAVDIHFPQILIEMGDLSTPVFEGFLPDSQAALNQSVSEVFERYGNRSLKALPIMFDVSVRTFVNTFMSDFIAERANCTHIRDFTFNITPPGDPVYPFTDYIDFRELFLVEANSSELGGRGLTTYGDTIRSLTVPITEELLAVDPETGLSGINGLIGPATGFLFGESGSIILPGDLFATDSLDFNVGTLMLNISFAIGDLHIQNLDTVGDPLQLLRPVFNEPHFLDNSMGIGLDGNPVKISLRISMNILNVDAESFEIVREVENDMIFSLDMHTAIAFFNVLLKIPEERFIDFPMRDFFNPWCWGALFPAPNLTKQGIKIPGQEDSVKLMDIALEFAKLNLTIECIKCSSPGMQGLIDTLAKNESSNALTSIANQMIEYGLDIVTGNLVQNAIDRGLLEAARRCPHDPRYVEGASNLHWEPLNFDRSLPVSNILFLLVGVLFGLIVIITFISFVVRFIVNRRFKRWLKSLPIQRLHLVLHQQEADKRMEAALNANTKSMFSTPEISRRVRFGMPIIILGNIAFFISGHLSIAAQVRLQLKIAGEPLTLDRLFDFTIVSSTLGMWEAGAREMAIFICTFALIWPYTKQLISLFCWFLPPERLSISRRGRTYLLLDALAKWSMVDIFVLLITMIAFRVEAVTPDVGFLPKDFFALNIRIIPTWGLYANLLAQTISQVSSHYIIHYHRQIVRRATRAYEDEHNLRPRKSLLSPTSQQVPEDTDENSGGTKEDSSDDSDQSDESNRLCDTAFARPHKGNQSRLVARQVANYGLVVVTVLVLLFLVVGSSLPSLSAEIQGLVSFVANAGEEGVTNEFNLFDVAYYLVKDAVSFGEFKYVAGYLFLAGNLLLTVFVVPIVQTLTLAYHWFKPMKERERNRYALVNEILAAWQYAEVYILAILISSWQLAPTSESIVAGQCSDFEVFFEMFSYYGILELEDSHCFRIEAQILAGSYLMFAGAFLMSMLNSFVTKANFQYFYDIEERRKEEALEERLTLEESLSPVDEKTMNKVTPPPVLFTDTFRWVLRPEHLGDRPLKGIIVEDPSSHKMLLPEQAMVDDHVGADEPSSRMKMKKIDGVDVVEL